MQHSELTQEVIGSAMEVHKVLGPGFLETIYQRALLRELVVRGLTVESERPIEILYKGHTVGKHRLDIIVANAVVVELKAVNSIADVHLAQALSYLKASRLNVALILNFGEPRLTWKRVVKSATSATNG
jgi:GxxExxY protein